MSSSWNDESSQTIHASGGAEPTSDVSGRPTFPATSTSLPAARKTVAEELRRGRLAVRTRDAENRVRKEPRAELDLAPDGHAARPRALDEHRLTRTPGLFTTRSIPCNSVSSSAPRWTSTPSSRSLPTSSVSSRSNPTTAAPAATKRLERPPFPERARPTTRTRLPASSNRSSHGSANWRKSR